MVNIVIIGSGQLGSRHLQSLSNIDILTSIFIVDPSVEALAIAKQRFEQVVSSDTNIASIEYTTSLNKLPKTIDVAIIATNSDVRKEAIEQLIDNRVVRFLIIEKFMFQSIQDYQDIENLLDKHAVQAFVNCPRRMWPFYKELKKMLKEATYINYEVSAANLGIGCNGIHFVDHLAYLSDETDFTFDNRCLDKTVIQSKRKGFIEFTGILYGYSNSKKYITIASFPTGDNPLIINISSDVLKCTIREIEGTALISSKNNNWKWEEISFDYIFQSQLTHLAVQQLLDEGTCELTTYRESCIHHTNLLMTFINHINIHTKKKVKLCPVT